MLRTKRLWKGIAAWMLSAAMFFAGIVNNPPMISEAAESNSSITFIALGEKGNATLVETTASGQKRYGLIDSGSREAYSSSVKPYLQTKGVKVLDFIIVSHMDMDHSQGFPEVISDFCDSSTTLYIKDATSSTEPNIITRYDRIMTGAKSIGMPIGKIKPRDTENSSNLSAVSTLNGIRNLPAAAFQTKLDIFTQKSNGSYTSDKKMDGIEFGEFYITLYNGKNWNKAPLVYNADGNWDENVNSVTTLLKYTGSDGKVFRTYLNADLGFNRKNQKTKEDTLYSQVVSEKTAEALGTQVSVYQVPHHGYYNGMNSATASKLNFKYAIVTNSYNEIASVGISRSPSQDATQALSFATNTLKAFLSLANLQKVYFTDGTNRVKEPTDTNYRIINALIDKVNYIDGDTIEDGNVVVSFGSTLDIKQVRQ